jgi:hypothetical protein
LVRSGKHQPRVHRFAAWDDEYVQQRTSAALQLSAQPLIMHINKACSSVELALSSSDLRII